MNSWILTLSLMAPVAQEAPQHHLLGVSAHDAHALAVAHEAGIALDCQALREDGTLELVGTDADLDFLLARGVRPTILQSNLERFYARRLAESDYVAPNTNPPFGGGGMGGYFTLAEVESILDDFAAAYPALCSPKVSIGTSIEGRDLWMVKISDNPLVDENEPEVRFDAVHHAREPMSMTSLLYYMDWLLQNHGTDPLATYLIDEREIYFVPIVNPDGYEYNRQTNPGGGGLWRKNRRNNGGGSFGVDLNRNYSYQWGYDNSGSSGNPGSETYRGPSPTSEPETQAMQAFIDSRLFQVSNSAHTYSDLWLYSWGYDCSFAPDDAAMDLIAEWFVKDNGYTKGSICRALYSANGNTVDYDYGVHGTFSGTIEIGGSSDGFWPPQSRIIPLAEENLTAYQRLSTYAAAGVENTGLTWTESAGDGDEYYEAGEQLALSTSLINPGVAATPGSVTLVASVVGSILEILDGSHDFGVLAASGGTANNSGDPLEVRISPTAQDGEVATLIAELQWDTYTERRELTIVIGEPTIFAIDDFETDYGWQYGVPGDDADTGDWERADPQATSSGGITYQPANDHSPVGTLCAVTDGRSGSSAGTYDVDGGPTTLVSPQFDLEDLVAPTVSFWRWFANDDGDDRLITEISNDDGASWTTVENLGQAQNAWTKVSFDPASLLPLTDRMRLRFITADEPNNSLTEALIDDVQVESGNARATLWRYGTPEVGQPIRLRLRNDPGIGFLLYAATAGGSFDLGKLGIWELDFSTMFKVLNGSTDGNGHWDLDTDLPDDPALSGVEIHLQSIVLDPQGAYFSNAVDFQVD